MRSFRKYIIEAPSKKYAQILWDQTKDPDDPQIQVFGLGVYTLKTLNKNVKSKIEDLAKRISSDIEFVHKQITSDKDILHNLVNALNDVSKEMNSSTGKRKITIMKKKKK